MTQLPYGLSRRVRILVFSLILSGGCAPDGADARSGLRAADPDSEAPPAVQREILARADNPVGLADQRLTLVRYTIAPGAELSAHIHPGVQMARITSGTLTYRIESGIVLIHRNVGADGVPASVEQLEGPADTTLEPGDAVVEDRTMLHFGSNLTNEPVVIIAALITDSNADLSVVQALD